VQQLIILPTYNEAQNIEQLVHAILRLDLGWHLLIIDDNSPDGTGCLANSLAARHPQVQVLHRPYKRGLGSAYRDGFRYALEQGAGLICEMDADFSHDPSVLYNFPAAMADYDLVIGSRYIKGGGVDGWPWHRRYLSRFANLYATALLMLPLRDCTSGFKCFRRRVLEAIELDQIISDGYAFQIEMNYHALQKGFRVKEIPIVFKERQHSASKISRSIVWEAFWLCVKLRAPLWQIVPRLCGAVLRGRSRGQDGEPPAVLSPGMTRQAEEKL
jgi:dolichol-phosphate mannosyltransferase